MICRNRVKPKLLRDIKTEALLVFVRTTLEDYFYQIEKGSCFFKLSNEEDMKYVHNNLRKLLDYLEDSVINSSYLRSLIENANKNVSLRLLAKKEEHLMVYYDSLVKSIERQLPNGTFWIPELIVICLLSEWIVEEEKSIYFYPFLKDFDYIDLINRYEVIKKDLEVDKKEVILNMFIISTKLIEKLKKVDFKFNSMKQKNKKR
ncbi:hypothetical protein NG790_06290 [Aliarcobacter cryaerophilus]|uniref:hypothetical protein n=1 Tax=Aliarcobacter cryaerophilus TaxID=28198 RepID=UPI003DA296DF